MARAREIKKRIGAVKAIQRITKTMQMIANTKFTAAVRRAQGAKPFSERIMRLLAEALAAAPEFVHPLTSAPATSPRRERLLVISSNRGLCGAYNANILRAAIAHCRELAGSGTELVLEIAGKKAGGFFKFQRIKVSKAHAFGDQPEYVRVAELAEMYMNDFATGEHDAVRVVSMHFESASRQQAKIIQLLPLAAAGHAAETGGPEALYDFSPSVEGVLEEMMPLAVKSVLFQLFLDAAVSEQIMRMIAMKAATENAKDLGKSLTRRFNRARQAQITTELMEVISGAAALA